MGHDRRQLLTAAFQVVHRDPVLAVRGAVRAEDRQFLVVQLVHIEMRDRVVLGQACEVDDPRALRRHLEGGLLRLLRGRGDDDALRATSLRALHRLGDPVVVPRDPRVVDERAHRAEGDVKALPVDVGDEHLARPAVAGHHGLPAPDRPRADDDHGVAEPDVQHLDAVQRAGEGVGHRGEVGRKVVRKGDQVLDRDRGHRRVLRVGAGVGVIAVQQVLVAQVLEALHAEPAATARQDRAQENPVALLDAGRKLGTGSDLFQDADRLVAEDPGRRSPGVAVEEGARVRAADAARLDTKDRARGVEQRLVDGPDFDHVDAGHEGRLHL